MNYFLDLYGTLPRAGPGSDVLTRRAYDLMTEVPERPHILDLGCGPGAQTVALLKHAPCTVLALDLFPEMIAQVHARAEQAGVADRLETVEMDMTKMDFQPETFNVIWSEGAIYFLGFENGLKKVHPFVKPGGYVAVSEAVWLQPDPPDEVVAFWKAYPEMDHIAAKRTGIERAGYELVGDFVLPASAWTERYYDPMTARIAEKEAAWRGIPEAEAVLKEARTEIAMFNRYTDSYSYAFFVMRKPPVSG